ncbi:sigma-70 family RNA polymerase sigma factor [Rossellomorea vietnamensis]|uniref:Sigma-70 family RNA polymerase sigma factor n=1 Tax=Rossellomorea vietnamensis TaxID=218284 RepID=A0A5D4M345_9BACI|nr:sigma-70 family RNA polymerase sigma factor [Rossellomorea vietnamensis]TYR95703.1 sigma-70 family RNA polymerase sigma factor [Rossellomorea vietnamensis]
MKTEIVNGLAKKAVECEKAQEEILTLMKSEMRKYIKSRRLYASGYETDDLIQVGLIGVFRSIFTFDETRGDFLPHAIVNGRSAIRVEINRSNNDKHKIIGESVSLQISVGFEQVNGDELTDVTSSGTASSFRTPEEQLDIKEKLALAKNIMNELFTDKGRKVIELYYFGDKKYLQKEIADYLGITKKSVDNHLYRFQLKVKEFHALYKEDKDIFLNSMMDYELDWLKNEPKLMKALVKYHYSGPKKSILELYYFQRHSYDKIEEMGYKRTQIYRVTNSFRNLMRKTLKAKKEVA